MRTLPWLATGLWLLLDTRAEAAGPRLQHERHWLFGHRCGVTFEAEGPRAWLVPNENFDVEGFASVWSDPLDGTLLLYTDGRDVWRGSDHQRIHQGAAGALSLQPAIVGPISFAGSGKFFLLAEEAPVTRYALLDLQGMHTSDFLVPSQRPALALFGRVSWGEAAVVVEWTSPDTPHPVLVTEGAVARGTLLSVGLQSFAWSTIRSDGLTVSVSRAGDRAVFIGMPGHVTVARGAPSDTAIPWQPTHQLEMLDANDPLGSVHHTMLSPDGTKLYVGIDDGVAGDRADIVQVDLATGIVTLLGRAPGRHAPSFGRGPDGVVYVGSAQPDDDLDVLGAITQPNALGIAAGFIPDALPLAPGCDVRRGLTNFVVGGMRLLDTDRDGVWDTHDNDNDNDGILDTTEGGPEFYDADYEVTGLFSWNRAGATTCAVDDGLECSVLTRALDPDADGLPSPSDLDSDGDGLPDLWECGGLDLDDDNDGRVDGPVDPFTGLALSAPQRLPLRCGDADDDGIVNALDLDSDGDGISDREEASGSTGADIAQSGWAPEGRDATRIGVQRDSDGDSIPDWLDAIDDRVQDAGTDASSGGLVDADTQDGSAEDAGTDAASSDAAAPALPDGTSPATSPPSPLDQGPEPEDVPSPQIDGGGCSCDSAPGAPAGSALTFVMVVLLLRRHQKRVRAVAVGVTTSLAFLACGADDNSIDSGDRNDASIPEVAPDSSGRDANATEPSDAEIATDGAFGGGDADAELDASFEDASLDGAVPATRGDLDPTFTPWTLRSGRSADRFGGAAVDTMGRIVASGTASHGHVATHHLVRYLPDGTLDLSFGGRGDVLADEGPYDSIHSAGSGVGIASNGTVYSLFRNRVRRFGEHGALDVVFDTVDVRHSEGDIARSMVVEADGSFVVVLTNAAAATTSLLRFSADGELDADWNDLPISDYALGDPIVWERNGRRAYAVVGTAAGRRDLLMLDEHGELDPTFATDGVATVTGPAWSGGTFTLAKVDAGWMVCASRYARAGVPSAFLLIRLDDHGTLDARFGQDGIVASTSREERLCAVRADSTAVALGTAGDMRHFDAAGKPNQWVSDDGVVTDPAHWLYGIAVQPADGRVLALGSTKEDDRDAWLTRVRRLGDVDPTFGAGAIPPLNFGQSDTEIIDAVQLADGRILAVLRTLIGYRRDVALVRFDSTGQIDPMFGEQGYVLRTLRTGADARVFVEDDGSLFFAGDFTAAPSAEAYLSADGHPLVRSARYVSSATEVARASDARFVSAYASSPHLAIRRRLSTGAPDTTYRDSGDSYHSGPSSLLELRGMTVDSDDSMLFALNGTTYAWPLPPVTRWSFLRVLPTGLNDPSFGVGGWKPMPTIDQGQLARMKRSGDSLWAFGTDTSAAGVRFAMVKMTMHAEPDMGFAESGVARVSTAADAYASDFAFREDGSITGAGCTWDRMTTVRWSGQGDPDATWGDLGVARIDAFGDGSCATRVLESVDRTWLLGRRTKGHVYEAVLSRLVR